MAAYTLSDWNDLLEQINALVAECPGVSELQLVTAPHVWTVQDVLDAQNKLIELCDDNSFSTPVKWLQSMVDELEAAVANGVCCCEEEDREFLTPADFVQIETATLVTFDPTFPGSLTKAFLDAQRYLVDWADRIMFSDVPEGTEELLLANGDTLELPKGGDGWVGRSFSQYQVFVELVQDSYVTPITSGPVVDGYIWIGSTASKELALLLHDAIIAHRVAVIALAHAEASGDPEDIAAAEAELAVKEAELASAQAASDAVPKAETWPYDSTRLPIGGNETTDVRIRDVGPPLGGTFDQTIAVPYDDPDDFAFAVESFPDSPYWLHYPVEPAERVEDPPGGRVPKIMLRLLCTTWAP